MATPRGLTQPHTSFIGLACQGIHHTPVTQNNTLRTTTQNGRHANKQLQKNKMLASTIQFSHNTHPTTTNHHNRQPGHGMPQKRNTQCCPRHPTACQHTKRFTLPRKLDAYNHASTHPNKNPTAAPTQGATTNRVPGVCPPGFIQTNAAVAHSTTQPHNTHNCGQTKNAP